jgi:hypothetical protein
MLLQRCTLDNVPAEAEPNPRLYVTLRPAAPLRLALRRRRLLYADVATRAAL